MSEQLLVSKIDGSVEQLIERAHLREQDLVRLNSITSPTRQQEWLMSRVLAWESRVLHIDVLENGAPVIEQGYISVSHAGGYVAVLFSDSPCGVDIESIIRDAAKISQKFATQEELKVANESFSRNPALLVWCAKEALYKRVGVVGVDFVEDMHIITVGRDTLTATAFDTQYEMLYMIQDELLIVTL